MNEEEFRQLLDRYQEGKLDETNRRQVEIWYNSFGNSTKIEPLENPVKKRKIHKELSDNLFAHTMFNKQEIRSKKRYYPIAAAILFFIVAGWLAWEQIESPARFKYLLSAQHRSIYETVQTDAGTEKKIILPDSSEIWLNAGSRLRYSINSFNNNREVFLDYGEAFFEVKRNPDNPFFVHTDDVVSKVLGTSFNVKNYLALDYTSVEVKTGKVQVISENNRLLIDTVQAGNGVKYSRKAGTFTMNNSFDAGSWREGRTLLVDATFNELAMVFYNRFKVNLKTHLPQSESFRYTISIMQNKPLDETLKLICDIHQTNYRRNENEITIY